MTITKEGALASFYTMNKAPIKHLRVYFSPKQAGEGDPSPENVREISGWDGVEIAHCGKNLFDKNTYLSSKNRMYVSYTTGSTYVWSNAYATTDFIPIKCGMKYILHDAFFAQQLAGAALYDKDKQYLTGFSINSKTNYTWPFIAPNDAAYIRFCVIHDYSYGITFDWEKCMIEVGESATEFEPYVGSTIPVDWSNDIGTVYGGYVDLVTGELVEEYHKITLDGITTNCKVNSDYSDNEYLVVGVVYLVPNGASDYQSNDSKLYCNNMPIITPSTRVTSIPCIRTISAGQQYLRIVLGNMSEYPDLDTKQKRIEFGNAYLQEHPIDIVYPLQSPVIHQLSPTALSTLIGRNNIWSNADRVEVEYDLAESNDELYRRRNILLRSAPHIETVSGSLAHFETDLVAPLKECKVYFEPVQEGEGDPSPDNVRAITGWNDIEVYQAGKNLLPSWRSLYANVFANNGTDKGMLVTHLDNGLKITGTATTSGNFNAGGAASRAQLNAQNAPLLKAYTNYIISAEKTSRIGCQGQMVESNREGWVYPNQSFRRSVDGKVWLYSGLAITEGTTYDEQIIIKQLEVGTIATEYEPYRGQTIPIVFPSEAGTIYGGHIDLINGELVQAWKSITLNGEETWSSQAPHTFSNIDYDTMFLSDSLSDMVYQQSTHGIISNMPTSTTASQKSNTGILCGQFGWSDRRFYIFNATQYLDGVSNVATLKAYLSQNPIQICYKLATPIHYTLTPTQLKTLRGQNNIWSNANGDISIKYWTH